MLFSLLCFRDPCRRVGSCDPNPLLTARTIRAIVYFVNQYTFCYWSDHCIGIESKPLPFDPNHTLGWTNRQGSDIMFGMTGRLTAMGDSITAAGWPEMLFDLEAVFLYPWVVLYRDFLADGRALFALGEMGVFLVVLLVGFIYAWKKGGLEWQ